MPVLALGELAQLVDGAVEGDATLPIHGLAALDRAEPGELSFVSGPRYAAAAAATRASALIAPPGLPLPGRAVIRVPEPQLAVATLLALFHQEIAPVPGVDPTARIAPTARVAPTATVLPHVVVGDQSVVEERAVLHPHVVVGPRCRVGEGSVLHPHVVLYQDVQVGRRVVIHAGAVLGADGFGYAFDGRRHRKIPQVGRVVVGDDVEIGANVAIDRATLGETVIGPGTKIDNLVQVGHNVVIGAGAILVAQVGLAGSCRVGDYAVLAGQVGVADHAEVGAGARVGAQAGVTGRLAPGETFLGSPAIPAGEAKRAMAALPRVPELIRAVRRLEKRVAELEARRAEPRGPEG